MKFGLEKCTKASFLKGRLEKSTLIQLHNSTKIKELKQEEVYKYLGVHESTGIEHATMKEKMRKEWKYNTRTWKSKWNKCGT